MHGIYVYTVTRHGQLELYELSIPRSLYLSFYINLYIMITAVQVSRIG